MTEIERVVDQMRRAFHRDAWCGSSLREALDGVAFDRAAARPLKNAHSIWEVVLHVAAWKGAVRQRLAGEPVRVPEEGDWPPVAEGQCRCMGGGSERALPEARGADVCGGRTDRRPLGRRPADGAE